jgi:hypothetical protein
MSAVRDLKKRMASFGPDVENILADLYSATSDISIGRVRPGLAASLIDRGSRTLSQVDQLISESMGVPPDGELAELLVQFLVSFKPRVVSAMGELKAALQTAVDGSASSSDDEEAAELLHAALEEATADDRNALPRGGPDLSAITDEGNAGDAGTETPWVLRQQGIVESPFGFVLARSRDPQLSEIDASDGYESGSENERQECQEALANLSRSTCALKFQSGRSGMSRSSSVLPCEASLWQCSLHPAATHPSGSRPSRSARPYGHYISDCGELRRRQRVHHLAIHRVKVF